tara:strand:+ start:11015 stop:11800 length:786 start_codon:yes stop_codon:yes gene_type:complete
MIIDTHAHIHQHEEHEIPEIISRASESRVTKIVNAGVNIKDSKLSLKISKIYENAYTGVGIHPEEIKSSITKKDLDILHELSKDKKVVTISEIGIDHQNHSPNLEIQEEAFYEQIKLAKKEKLPIIFHIREKNNDVEESYAKDIAIKIFSELSPGDTGGAAHYFSGKWEYAKKLLDLGFMISFAKPIIYNKFLHETVLNTPIDKIIVETDSYPQYYKPDRAKWTEPKDISKIIQKISEIRNQDCKFLEEKIYKNSNKLLKF